MMTPGAVCVLRTQEGIDAAMYGAVDLRLQIPQARLRCCRRAEKLEEAEKRNCDPRRHEMADGHDTGMSSCMELGFLDQSRQRGYPGEEAGRIPVSIGILAFHVTLPP